MSTFRSSLPAADRPAARGLPASDDEGRLRLIWILLEVLCGVAATFGVIWDTQYHAAIGREGMLSPPHLVIYGSFGAGFVVALAAIVVTTRRYRQGAPGADDRTTARLPWGLRAPPGYVAVAAGLLSLFPALPLDDYWHRLYGMDIHIWAPFHLMPAPGAFLAVTGVLYAAFAEANRRDDRNLASVRGMGLLILAILMFTPTALAAPAVRDPLVGAPLFGPLPLYVPMLGGVAGLFLLAASRSVTGAWAATAVALLYSLLLLLLATWVPLLVAAQAAVGGLYYRVEAPADVYFLAGAPLLLVVPALAVDAVALLAARRGWEVGEWVPWAGALAAVLACLVDRPWQPYVIDAASGSAWHLLVLSLPLAAGVGALAGVAGARAGDALQGAGR